MGFGLVGFDGDDTLWHSEGYFRAAHAEFEAIVGNYVDLADAGLHERLLETERRNIKLFGYGAKGMTLSMVETAIALTGLALRWMRMLLGSESSSLHYTRRRLARLAVAHPDAAERTA